jgi:DNA-binding XRE family transcriptional regulator
VAPADKGPASCGASDVGGATVSLAGLPNEPVLAGLGPRRLWAWTGRYRPGPRAGLERAGAVAEQPGLGFAGLLRQLRAETGLTQEELAEAAGVSPRSVSDLERGIHRTAHKDTAELLADALGLTGPATAVCHCHRRSAAHHPHGRHPARPSSHGPGHPYSTDRERLLRWLRLLGTGRHPGGSAARFAPEPGRPGLPTARAAGDQMSQTGRTRRMTGAVVPAGAATGGATDRVRPQRQPAGGPLLTWMTQALLAEAGVLRTGRKSW